MPIDHSQIMNIILSTLGVIFIAFISIFVIKKLKFGNLTKNNPIKILFQYPVTNKDKLLLIEVKNKEILLGLSSSGFCSLAELKNLNKKTCDDSNNDGLFINTLNKTIKSNVNKNAGRKTNRGFNKMSSKKAKSRTKYITK